MAGDWQRLNSLDDQLSGKVTADEADHLLVVKSCYDFVMRGRMEDLLYLLKERLTVQLGSRYKRVFSEQDMLAAKGSVEVVV